MPGLKPKYRQERCKRCRQVVEEVPVEVKVKVCPEPYLPPCGMGGVRRDLKPWKGYRAMARERRLAAERLAGEPSEDVPNDTGSFDEE